MQPHVTVSTRLLLTPSIVWKLIHSLYIMWRYTSDRQTDWDVQQSDGLPKVLRVDRTIAAVELLLITYYSVTGDNGFGSFLGLKGNSLYHNRGAH